AVRAEREFRIEFAPPAKLPFSLIRLNHVEAGYGKDAVILHNVGFGLEAGQRIGLLGPNGAGKTTLIGQLSGELRPDGGRVLLDGEDVTRLPVERRVR
ncbi:ATP-binding cassette domain-containing protein, partial [Listeria seeligeri]|uniref:ATP-binding cassette domain-containing protein n=1 Tax=Listeria seeligeri TaxID=1640 RepID=UPI0022EBC938